MTFPEALKIAIDDLKDLLSLPPISNSTAMHRCIYLRNLANLQAYSEHRAQYKNGVPKLFKAPSEQMRKHCQACVAERKESHG
jgi:hypothetical protein